LPQPSQAFPSPEELKKYVCEVATQKMIEDQATGEICALINSTFPGARFDPDCKTLLEEAWDFVTRYCPKGHLSMPSPRDVEKYVCDVATQKLVEEMATDKVCQLIEKRFPKVHFNPNCHTAVERVWDKVTSFCPKGRLSMPGPRDVEKYVCDVVTQKLVEEMATDKVCQLIKENFPSVHFKPDCHTAVEMAWDKVASLCPKGLLMPSPQKVEKYVCDVATQKLVEEMATGKVCKLIQETFPNVHFNPDCHTAVEMVWDKVTSFCPKGRVSMPSPHTVVKYVCKVATTKLIEDAATDKVCELITHEFPQVHFSPDCHTAVEKAWDEVASFCPKGSAFMPSPRDVEKYVCDVATQKLIEEMATDKVCGLIGKKFPRVHFHPDCHSAVEKVWNRVVSLCPKDMDAIVV